MIKNNYIRGDRLTGFTQINNESAVMPGITDVWNARHRISKMVNKTPLVYSHEISEQFGSNIYLKLENLHETGAFKIRGAASKILSMTTEQKKHGVATYSTGNHGISVSYVAKKLNIPAYVFVSERVPDAKVDYLRRLGANVVIKGNSQDEAGLNCHEVAEREGYTVVEPFDDPYVISGQATIGLEIFDDLPMVDTVIVPLSGGGLLSGVAMALKSINPNIRVLGVSMEQGAVMYHSLRAGKPLELDEADTLADSLLGGIGLDNKYTFSMVKKYMDEAYLIPENHIAMGMAYVLKNHKMAVEGASAIGVGAVLGRHIESLGSNTVIIVSGNNVNITSFLHAVNEYLG